MTKLLLLFFSCLLVFGGLHAQTDSTRPPQGPPVQAHDTGVVVQPLPRHDSTVRHLSHGDSVRRDSIARARRAIRDSLRAAAATTATTTAATTAAAPKDSPTIAKPVSASTPSSGRPVSASPPPASASLPSASLRSVSLPVPYALDFWEKVLAQNPFFNFTGKPVVEIFEIHHPNSKDSLFYLIVAILFYFALIRIFFEKYFNNLMTLFFRVSLRQQQIREQVLQTPLPSLLLNILFVISAGLYACFLFHYSQLGAGIRFWILYLNCIALLGTIYLVKFVVLKFIGWVFSISRATDIYIFIVFLVNKMLGIFLLPFLIIIIFSGQEWREIFITISLAMIFVLWSYRILAAYRPVRNEIKLTPFYFFLYLCAFEIAPLLLIYKVLLTYLEKVY